MTFRPYIAALFILALTLAAEGNAQALRLGTLQAHPYVDFKTVYDDNVFVQNSNGVGDWYFLITPGLLIQLPHGKNMYELEYKAGIYRYVDTGDSNDMVNHSIRVAADMKFPGGLSLKLKDLAISANETRGESNLAVTGRTTTTVSYMSNGFDAEIAYEVSPKFKASVAYQNYLVGYSPAIEKFRDRVDNGVSGTVFYKFMPRTSLLLQGIYKNVHHDQDSLDARLLDSDEYWVMAGITREVTGKTTGVVKVGYEWKNFSHNPESGFASPVYEVSVDHKFTPKTSIRVAGIRQAKETDDPNVSYYTTTKGTLEVLFKPVRDVSVKPYGSIADDRYSGATTVFGDTARRLELAWTSGVDVGYKMNKWLLFTAGYLHTKRSSTITFYDYTDNSVLLGFKASL